MSLRKIIFITSLSIALSLAEHYLSDLTDYEDYNPDILLPNLNKIAHYSDIQFNKTENVHFYLYDCNDLINDRIYNSTGGTRIFLNDSKSLNNTSFDKAKPIRLLIHGWLGNRASPFFRYIVQAYLFDSCRSRLTNDHNLILIDWSLISRGNYNLAKSRIPGIGKFVAEFLDYLVIDMEIKMDNVGIIGFSMGAHIAGIAGKNVQQGKIGVIVALDPAGREFRYNEPHNRLNATDAEYVEVIHTNAGDEQGRRWGIDIPIGHADFYPNGGAFQGCAINCAHYRAIRYFAESLLPNTQGFLARDCENYKSLLIERRCVESKDKIAIMGGEPPQRSQKGIFYLRTRFTSPYGRGLSGL